MQSLAKSWLSQNFRSFRKTSPIMLAALVVVGCAHHNYGTASEQKPEHGEVESEKGDIAAQNDKPAQLDDAAITSIFSAESFQLKSSLAFSGGLSAAETFYANGTWYAIRDQRARVLIRGAWFIESDQICIIEEKNDFPRLKSGPKICRNVFEDKNTGQVFMFYVEQFDDVNRINLIKDNG